MNDGGPAFPNEGGELSGLHAATGMSLRDWFAGQVMNDAMRLAMIPHSDYPDTIKTEAHKCAVRAYIMADAMLAARTKPSPEIPCLTK